MIRLLVQYRIKPGVVEQARQAVTRFVDAIQANEPHTIYGSFVSTDGRSFVHAMAFPDEQTEIRHRSAAHTKAFVEFLSSNCDEEPRFTQLELVRSTKKGGGFLGME